LHANNNHYEYLPHNKFFATEIATNHNVVAVVHPVIKKLKRFRKLRKEVIMNGLLYTSMRFLGQFYGWNYEEDMQSNEQAYFGHAEESYQKLDKALIRHILDVNDLESIRELQSLKPDVVACLGGPIYRKSFIQSFPLVLNYHSGLSRFIMEPPRSDLLLQMGIHISVEVH